VEALELVPDREHVKAVGYQQMQRNIDPYTNSRGDLFRLSVQDISTEDETEYWLCLVRAISATGQSRTYKIFVLKSLVAELDQVVTFALGEPLAYIKALLETFEEKEPQAPMPKKDLADGWTITIWGAGIPNSVIPLL
jgi:hypothetical protein